MEPQEPTIIEEPASLRTALSKFIKTPSTTHFYGLRMAARTVQAKFLAEKFGVRLTKEPVEAGPVEENTSASELVETSKVFSKKPSAENYRLLLSQAMRYQAQYLAEEYGVTL